MNTTDHLRALSASDLFGLALVFIALGFMLRRHVVSLLRGMLRWMACRKSARAEDVQSGRTGLSRQESRQEKTAARQHRLGHQGCCPCSDPKTPLLEKIERFYPLDHCLDSGNRSDLAMAVLSRWCASQDHKTDALESESLQSIRRWCNDSCLMRRGLWSDGDCPNV